GRGAEDPEQHLGLDAVAVHVPAPQHGIGDAADTLSGVVVEPRGCHDVDPVVAARHVLLAGRPYAAHQAERATVPGGPVRAVEARQLRRPAARGVSIRSRASYLSGRPASAHSSAAAPLNRGTP